MRYTDYVSTNQGFQTSVNLELHLNDKDKIKDIKDNKIIGSSQTEIRILGSANN